MTVSSLLIFMIVLFLALAIFLGTPIAVALGLAAVAELVLQGEVPLMIAAQRIFNGVNSVTLMGIPFFMLVGSIMERSGITQKLIDFANSLVGWLRGGLCYVGVLTGILMGGISGSAPADTAALSSIMVPSMERSGYDREFSAALMASSGTLGIIIPPSMPMIVLASITGISVGKLFLGGIIPLFGNSVHNQLWVMFVVNLVFFIGGFFLEGTAMQIMFIPVLLPIVQAAGINEIAFGVTVICNIAIGNLTPPVGVCLYVAANSSHAKVEGIIKNIAPFVLMAMVDIGILMVFPQLITLIPDMMH